MFATGRDEMDWPDSSIFASVSPPENPAGTDNPSCDRDVLDKSRDPALRPPSTVFRRSTSETGTVGGVAGGMAVAAC